VVRFNAASLYPLLYRLERRGWLQGHWVEAAGSNELVSLDGVEPRHQIDSFFNRVSPATSTPSVRRCWPDATSATATAPERPRSRSSVRRWPAC
jgi:hypothetical protein